MLVICRCQEVFAICEGKMPLTGNYIAINLKILHSESESILTLYLNIKCNLYKYSNTREDTFYETRA